jgi:hypothetical protein
MPTTNNTVVHTGGKLKFLTFVRTLIDEPLHQPSVRDGATTALRVKAPLTHKTLPSGTVIQSAVVYDAVD